MAKPKKGLAARRAEVPGNVAKTKYHVPGSQNRNK